MTRTAGRAGKAKRVALVIETSNAYARGLLEGIGSFLREQRLPWAVDLVEHARGSPGDLAGWKGDGVIARLENARVSHAVMALGVPVVDVSSARLSPQIVPWVETDDVAIAQMAFEHLRQRGFRRFAFVGDRGFNWSRWRGEAFTSLARQHGHEVDVFDSSQKRRNLARWLRGLLPPVGLMAAYDSLAREVLQVCKAGGVAVPESVAVIGVDDDPLLCALCTPSLTSVRPDARGAGERAAQTLQLLMTGRAVAAVAIRIPPLGISERQSTETLAVADQVVRQALRFIRDHAQEGIKVPDVLAGSRLSRRVFDARFLSAVGHSPADEIARCRLAAVKQLLAETDLAIYEIAQRTGYTHAEYLCVQFRRWFKETPLHFRRRYRPKRAS
ncbi:MAG: DNA-binding transcriptional regulator [Deltaproteobacteria bacterium]|nr:DNA-binding transcriptional regulator [Deltaproteobacteria bacterium]